MIDSHIGWTDDTYNPIILEGGGFYCFKVSPGCTHCYAEKVSNRFNHDNFVPYRNMKEYPKLELKEGMLAGWAKKKKPRKNFVSSMTDVFGEFVPEEWVFKILDAMIAAPLQIFQVLTKRSKRMKELVAKYCNRTGIKKLPQHIWLIVSVENQDYVSRALDLIGTRCTIRGLSIEPLIGEVNLCMPLKEPIGVEDGFVFPVVYVEKIIEAIDWVIVGGESGQKARIMNPEWPYNIKRQCDLYNVPFFFKQWGEWVGGKLDNRKGKILLEDKGIFWTNPGHPPVFVHEENEIEGYPTWKSVSVHVGKRERALNYMDGTSAASDNALLSGKHYFNFPRYLTVEKCKEIGITSIEDINWILDRNPSPEEMEERIQYIISQK